MESSYQCPSGSPPARCELFDEIYSPTVVMARVGHLDRSKRGDVEQITQIIRESFNGAGVLVPTPKITKIVLIGRYARRTAPRDEGGGVVPAFNIWIIVNDRLFTRKRLWQATEAQIREALGDRAVVTLSFSTTRGVRVGRKSGDEFIVDRLANSITLFDAERDAPCSQRRKGKANWAEALARFQSAEAAFLPAVDAFRDAERALFSEGSDGAVVPADRSRVDAAAANERSCGDALHHATMALIHTPAPDLAAIIRKLELVRDNGDGDDHSTVSILADVHWVAARLAAVGKFL